MIQMLISFCVNQKMVVDMKGKERCDVNKYIQERQLPILQSVYHSEKPKLYREKEYLKI